MRTGQGMAMTDTTNQLVAVLREATEAVSLAGVPEALQVSAFERVLDVVLERHGISMGPSVAPPQVPVVAVAGAHGQPPRSGSSALDAIAERAGVTTDAIRQVYRLDGDKLSVVVGSKKIDASSAAGSRELTLLVAGGRQAARIDEEWTPIAEAREVCSRYSRLDSNNYATTIVAMDDEFAFHGQGSSRELRLSMPGWDAWQELIQRLVKGEI